MGAGLTQLARTCHECGKKFTIEDASLWVYKLKHHDHTHWFCRYNCMRAAEKRNAERKRKKPTTRKPTKDELDALLDGGMSVAEIAGEYDCHKSSVHHWIKIYGLKGIKERSKVAHE
jgi:transposase-like protein